MGSVLAVKIGLMVTFFLEVTIFGNFISDLACFHNKTIMDLAMTFSGTLFLSIALLDITPQAIEHFDDFFKESFSKEVSSPFHQGKLPLTMIIAVVTMLIIMYLDKLLIGHSHDPEYELSFVTGPKKNEDDKLIQMKKVGSELHSDNDNLPSQRQEEQKFHEDASEINWRPLILQIGMGIHAFFETLALGLQKNTIGLLSLASAILVHKWAEGLTLGLMYKKEGYGGRVAMMMVVIQGCINIAGLLVGSMLMSQGNFVMAFFMSMSVGTFLYISLGEVLQEQLQHFTKTKLLMVLLANSFIAFIVWFQRQTQAGAQTAES